MTPAGKGGALWLQPVVQPGQSKHRADMPEFGETGGARVTAVAAGSENCLADLPRFGITGWGKGDGRAGRVRKLATWKRAMEIHSLKRFVILCQMPLFKGLLGPGPGTSRVVRRDSYNWLASL